MNTINPSTNEVIEEVADSTKDEVRQKVQLAHKAKQSWRESGVEGRIELLREVSKKFEENKQKLAELQAEEMGMPIKEAVEDIEFGLEYFNSYLDTGEEHLKPITTVDNEKELHQVFKEPYGVVACIVPWNFPFANWVWQCGQNLVAGNVVVFKHSEETPLSGKLLEEIVNGILPEGVFNEVYGDGLVGQELVKQDISMICFTGSSATGAKINEQAAKRMIPTCMELGGSAPGIIFDDANIDDVIETIFTLRFMNCGQMCDGLKRLIVHKSKYDEVLSALKKLIESKNIGDAQDKTTDVGPLVAKRQLDLLEAQVADGLEKGAKIEIGGKQPEGLSGFFYQPTLLTNINSEMRVWQEEVFGPVLPMVKFSTEDEAIKLANDTQYGLGAYIFTENKDRFMRVAQDLESGMVSQNNVSYINVCNPFTGYKMSGGGREHGQFGFDEVTRIKVIARQK